MLSTAVNPVNASTTNPRMVIPHRAHHPRRRRPRPGWAGVSVTASPSAVFPPRPPSPPTRPLSPPTATTPTRRHPSRQILLVDSVPIGGLQHIPTSAAHHVHHPVQPQHPADHQPQQQVHLRVTPVVDQVGGEVGGPPQRHQDR